MTHQKLLTVYHLENRIQRLIQALSGDRNGAKLSTPTHWPMSQRQATPKSKFDEAKTLSLAFK